MLGVALGVEGLAASKLAAFLAGEGALAGTAGAAAEAVGAVGVVGVVGVAGASAGGICATDLADLVLANSCSTYGVLDPVKKK